MTRREQQEQIRQVLSGRGYASPAPVHGRRQKRPVTPPAPAVGGTDAGIYDDYDAPPRKKGSPVGWVVLAVLLVLLLAAGTVLFLVLTDRLSLERIFGGGSTSQQAIGSNPVLAETADAGQVYVDDTVFIGDSNTVRLRSFALVDAGMVAAEESIGIAAVQNTPLFQVQGQDGQLTIEQTIAAMKPRRILIMLGSNDIGNISLEEFIAAYASALDGLRAASESTDIVVAAIPPASAQSSYPNLTPQAIAQFNEALKALCAEKGLPYLDTHEALAGPDGTLPLEYSDGDGVHLTQQALEILLTYYREHAWAA